MLGSTFDSLEGWKMEFLQQANVSDPGGFPFVVFGNKVDVDPEQRRVRPL